jgi:hypothetical protein
MEQKSELSMAIESFASEVEGMSEYRELAATVKDPALKKMFNEFANVEKLHANALLNWINTSSKSMLR